jgi:phosphohistidine phosphatase SixA
MKMRDQRPMVAAVLLVAGSSLAQVEALATQPASTPEGLVAALRRGGHVVVMRHARAPRELPTPQTAHPDNTALERQLDEVGRDGAAAMGAAWRSLGIPVGSVLSSPTFRARQTVRYAELPPPTLMEELGDGGQSMSGVSEAQVAFLRALAGRLPVGGNTLIVTHVPNIPRAFPERAADIAEGEALVFGPDGKGGSTFVARIVIDEWPRLACRARPC